MIEKDFETSLLHGLSQIKVESSKSQIEKFKMYMQLLLEWNEKMNLTAITEQSEIITKHFVDSLTIEKHMAQGSSIIDIGTGEGFPGIPLKIIRDDINVTLLDSLNKRISFLNETIEKLELQKIKAIHGRAEEMARDRRIQRTIRCGSIKSSSSIECFVRIYGAVCENRRKNHLYEGT